MVSKGWDHEAARITLETIKEMFFKPNETKVKEIESSNSYVGMSWDTKIVFGSSLKDMPIKPSLTVLGAKPSELVRVPTLTDLGINGDMTELMLLSLCVENICKELVKPDEH
jgi:hypothetical protein